MYSIIAGILASVLPNLFFAWLYFGRAAKTPQDFIRGFYLGEGLKYAGLVFLLSVFLQLPGLHVVKFFSAFLLSEMTRLFYQFFKLARTTAK